MKILYGIQGTGNGHLTRAMELLPALQKKGEVDILVSGMHAELKLPMEIKHQFHGLGFVFGKKGGIDYFETYKKNKVKRFLKEVKSLKVNQYDLVVSDFEPITAWASMQKKKLCVGLSNQASLLMDEVPKAKSDDFVGKFIIRNYAPCALNFGFNYQSYSDQVKLPVIRASVRNAEVTNAGHNVLYLPSYSDEKILKVLSELKGEWHVFSKHAIKAYTVGGVSVFPLNKELFEASFTSCSGIVTAAGFGTTTEALYMGKKLLVIPQKHQYEQACNAYILKNMNVSVLKSFKSKHLEDIEHWMDSTDRVSVHYPNNTEMLIDEMISAYQDYDDPYIDYLTEKQFQLKTA